MFSINIRSFWRVFVIAVFVVVVGVTTQYRLVSTNPYHLYGQQDYGNKGGLVDVDVHNTDHGKHVGVHVP